MPEKYEMDGGMIVQKYIDCPCGCERQKSYYDIDTERNVVYCMGCKKIWQVSVGDNK